VDHYIPIARGGRNDYFNLVIACPDCNHAKGAKMPAEFAVYRAKSAQTGVL
jgi:5-methylcytosine-specific restriction endonuclease McrA